MLTLFHDYTSPGSAVAARRLQRLADEGLPVGFEGFETVGVDVAVSVPADILAAVEDLREAAADAGLILVPPGRLPPTGLAHVVGGVAERSGLGASWREVCYRAFWEAEADVGDRAVLAALARDAGLDAAATQAVLSDRGRLLATRRRMALHRREGVGGVPTILARFGAGPPAVGGGLGYAGTLIPGLLAEADLRALAAL